MREQQRVTFSITALNVSAMERRFDCTPSSVPIADRTQQRTLVQLATRNDGPGAAAVVAYFSLTLSTPSPGSNAITSIARCANTACNRRLTACSTSLAIAAGSPSPPARPLTIAI